MGLSVVLNVIITVGGDAMRRTVVMFVLLLAVTSGAAWAQPAPITPRAALERLMTERPIRAEWFAPAVLAQLSPDRVEQIIAGFSEELGPYREVREEDGAFVTVFERGLV